MNEENVQLDLGDSQEQAQHPEMTDDETAAALGFITTLSEQMMTPGEEDDLQEENPEEAPAPVSETETPEEPVEDLEAKKNEARDAEIEAIRKELEVLKQEVEDDDTEGEDTYDEKS